MSLAGQIERGVLLQDRALESLQRGARLEADLLDQGPARCLVGLERLGLSPAAIQRGHQLPVQALAQRITGYEGLEFTHHVVVTAQCQVCLDAVFDGT